MNKKFFLRTVISMIILFLLFYKVGFLEIQNTLSNANFLFLILMILVYIPIYILGIFNLFVLFGDMKFRDLVKPYLLSWSLGMFVPGKFGELSIFYFLKKKKKLNDSVPVFLLDKLISFVVYILFVIIGFLFFKELLGLDYLYQVLLICAVILALVLIFILWDKPKKILEKYVLRKYFKYFSGTFDNLKSYFSSYFNRLIINFLLTIVRLVFTAFVVYLGFLAMDPTLNVNLIYIMVITSIISLVSLIPITLSGLGLRELLAVFLYGLIGIDAGVIFGAYVLLLIVRYVMGGLILGIFFNFESKKEKHHGCMGIIRYHRLNKAKRFLIGKTLDVGCSDGASLSFYDNVDIEGIEIEEDLVKIAKKWGKVRVASAENLPYKDNSFETVVCSDVIEHVDNREKALKEIERVAKKRIILSFPLSSFRGHPCFMKEIPKFKGWKIIYKSWLMPAIGIPFKGRSFNNEEHMNIVNKKWWFPVFVFFRPFLIFLFDLAGKFERNTVFLVYEKE